MPATVGWLMMGSIRDAIVGGKLSEEEVWVYKDADGKGRAMTSR